MIYRYTLILRFQWLMTVFGIFTNFPTSIFHIRTRRGASLQGWKDSNLSKAAEVAIDHCFKLWNPKVKGRKSSLAIKVMIKTLERKYKLTSSTRIKKRKQIWSLFMDRVLLPRRCGVNASRYLILNYWLPRCFWHSFGRPQRDERLIWVNHEATKWLCILYHNYEMGWE